MLRRVLLAVFLLCALTGGLLAEEGPWAIVARRRAY